MKYILKWIILEIKMGVSHKVKKGLLTEQEKVG